ncbi:hypothetical protein D3C81_2227360 [compost metagenome]
MIRRAPEFGLNLRGSYQLDVTVDDDLLVLGYGGIKDAGYRPGGSAPEAALRLDNKRITVNAP